MISNPYNISSSTLNDGMMLIEISHLKMKDLLQPFISPDHRSQSFFESCDDGTDQNLWIDEFLIDFGCKYRLIVQQGQNNNNENNSKIEIIVHASIVGWDQLKDHAIVALKSAFGSDAVNFYPRKDPDANGDRDENDDATEQTVYPGFDFSIKVSSGCLPKGVTFASRCESLSQLRSLVLGSRLMDVLKSLSNYSELSINRENQTFTIPIQRQCKIIMSMVVTKIEMERVIVVIPVACLDDIDRALTKLFLQQFQQAQRKTSAKNVPICEFRRSNEPPREITSFLEGMRSDVFYRDALAGYMSFTFLDSYFKSGKDHDLVAKKITNNLLMFTDFMDYHVKCSKSYIHTRMRQKKDFLLNQFNI